jgi:hypothetical protein
MSEHQEQAALIRWAAMSEHQHPELRLLFAIPNGGARSKAAAGKLKAEGVRPGIPDLCLPVPRGGYSALYIELKVPASPGKPKGRETSTQRDMRLALTEAGNHCVVCWGWIEARDAIELYL